MQAADPTAGSAVVGGWSYNLDSGNYNFTLPVLGLAGRARRRQSERVGARGAALEHLLLLEQLGEDHVPGGHRHDDHDDQRAAGDEVADLPRHAFMPYRKRYNVRLGEDGTQATMRRLANLGFGWRRKRDDNVRDYQRAFAMVDFNISIPEAGLRLASVVNPLDAKYRGFLD